jgi:hypothetical protein
MPSVPAVYRPDHTYELPGGRVVGGVTRILRAAGLLYELNGNSHLDPSKGDRIHSAIHYALEGDLDEASVDPDEYGFVRQALDWCRSEGLEEIRPEYAVGNPDLGYATKIDVLCLWRGKPSCINWKSSATTYEFWRWQSALESLLFSPEPVQRLSVQLTGSGLPKIHHHTDRRDYEVAKAALTIAAAVSGGKKR